MTKQEAQALVMEAQLAEEAAGNGDRPPSANTVESWLMIGLTGTVSMLQRLTRAGMPMSEWWRRVLRQQIDRLLEVADHHDSQSR